MVFGSALFIKHIKTAELEWYMCEAKKRFPQVQVMFVVINRKGDSAYGKYISLSLITPFSIYLFVFLFYRDCEEGGGPGSEHDVAVHPVEERVG